jgi:hypothetical protein
MLIKFCIGMFCLLLCYGMLNSRFAQSQPPAAPITSGTQPGTTNAIPAFSQCYYSAISSDGKNLSVHLQVIQRSPKSARRDAIGEFWNARFRRAGEDNESKEAREEGEEDAPKAPVSVHGIGSEAFWLGSSRGGALFVRKDDKLVRVSVGGSDDAKTKIAKSKTLAKKALARLK